MIAVNLGLWLLGVGLIAVGYLRAKVPWSRYQQLRDQEANIARYEAWRGGLRSSQPTGASVAMALARRQAQMWGAVAGAGVVLVFLGFLVR